MWCGHVEHHVEDKLKTIYFDAFKNDYQTDPFLAITSEINSLFPDDVQTTVLESAKGAAKALARGGLKLGTKLITAGILDGTELEDISADISGQINDHIDGLVQERLQKAEADKQAILDFRETIEKAVNGLEDVKQVVFIIDELDRCKPDYALEILEVIKHFFSVPGLSFLLVVNRTQLEASIQKRYGNIDASTYLNKFVHLFAQLSSSQLRGQKNDSAKYFTYCVENMTNNLSTDAITFLRHLVELYPPSLREIERLLAVYNVAFASNLISYSGGGYNYDNYLVVFYIWTSVIKPEVVEPLRQNKQNGSHIVGLSGLEEAIHMSQRQQKIIKEIVGVVRFDKGTDEERDRLLKDGKSYIYKLVSECLDPNTARNQLIRIAEQFAQMSV